MLLSLFIAFIFNASAQNLADDPSLLDLEGKRRLEIQNMPHGYFGGPSAKVIQAEFEKRNEETISRLENDRPPVINQRVQGLTRAQVKQIFESLHKHPIASRWQIDRYSRENTDIGYCFGRAAYFHLLLLRLGVSKESLRKVWVIANIQQSGSDWGHHVALTVKGVRKGDWWVLDPFVGDVVSAREWYAQMKRYTRDPHLRMYTTEAAKFSLNLGVYDPVQLGLRLPREADWYKGFFWDLMTWFRTEGPESLGLKPFTRAPVACSKVHG